MFMLYYISGAIACGISFYKHEIQIELRYGDVLLSKVIGTLFFAFFCASLFGLLWWPFKLICAINKYIQRKAWFNRVVYKKPVKQN